MPRYIDAEKLLDQFLELCGWKSCLDCQFFEHGCNLELMILNQPIADVQPVRHGKWIWHDVKGVAFYRKECSVCGWDHVLNSNYLYCPYCGAKMDGDNNA